MLVLRRTDPDRLRAFRVSLAPGFSILCHFRLMAGLPLETWMRVFVWLILARRGVTDLRADGSTQ